MRFQVNIGNWKITQIAYKGNNWYHHSQPLADNEAMVKEMVDQSTKHYADQGYKLAAKATNELDGATMFFPDEQTYLRALAIYDGSKASLSESVALK